MWEREREKERRLWGERERMSEREKEYMRGREGESLTLQSASQGVAHSQHHLEACSEGKCSTPTSELPNQTF